MAPQVKHKFTSLVPDSIDTSIVRPSNWNDDHDILNLQELGIQSSGIWVVPSLSFGTNTVTLGSGEYLLYQTSDFDETVLTKYTIAGGTFTIAEDGLQHYIVADYNGGGIGIPAIKQIDNVLLINQSDVIPLLTVYNLLGTVYYLLWDQMARGLSNKLCHRLVKTERFSIETGGLMLSELPGRIVNITSGDVWYGACVDHKDEVTSNIAGNEIAFWYHVAGNWVRSEVTQYNNSQYDDGTDLQLLGNGRYGVCWVYRGLFNPHSHPIIVLGGGNYKQAEAIISFPPSNLPAAISNFAILVGRIIIENGSSTASQIDSAFDEDLSLSGVADHNGLAGLQGGDATLKEFYHLTSDELLRNPGVVKDIIMTPDSSGQCTVTRNIYSDDGSCMAFVVDYNYGARVSFSADTSGFYGNYSRKVLSLDGTNKKILYNSANDWVGPLAVYYVLADHYSDGTDINFSLALLGAAATDVLTSSFGGAWNELNTTAKNVQGAINELAANKAEKTFAIAMAIALG